MATPDESEAISSSHGEPHPRGDLRVYLGAAPGSGKTFAMLREGHQRRANGEDVVVGFVEPHGRRRTMEAIGDLPIVSRIQVIYKSTVLEDMDVDAVIARHPQIALVDELAHTNAPGLRHSKRWEDVEDLRNAGIDVITTMNVQHLESLKDLVEHITGIPVRETVPDAVVDTASELHFIDISPEALRKRMKHGNIYASDKVETALANFFREGNLAALRELALRLVAQRVGNVRASVSGPPQDVLVAVEDSENAEDLIRRGGRIARRFGGMCTALHVIHRRSEQTSNRLALIAAHLGASLITTHGDVAPTIVKVAHERGVRHVVIGESTRPSRWPWREPIATILIGELVDVDLHVISRLGRGELHRNLVAQEGRRTPEQLLAMTRELPDRRANLRMYLGYAQGCGTTTAMLDEARRRAGRGTDVVVAALQRDHLASPPSPEGLEILGGPDGAAAHGILDVEALLARNPDVACVDSAIGPTVDGQSRVYALSSLVAAGITVLTTLHVTELRSTVAAMGKALPPRPPDSIVDDEILKGVDELELVDVTPTELIKRVNAGGAIPLDKAQAVQEEFRLQNLQALREIAFRIVAEHTDRRLVAYMHNRKIDQPWEARSRIMVVLPPWPGMQPLIRRAATLAERSDGSLTAVTVRTRKRQDIDKKVGGEYATLTHRLGGEFVTLHGAPVAAVLARYAQTQLTTEILIARGPRRGPWGYGTIESLILLLADVDVHVLADRRARRRSRRRWLPWAA